MDAPVKFCDSSSNGFRDKQQRSRRKRHFDRFLNFDNCQPEGYSDFTSNVFVDPTGMKARAKFGDSMSNRSRATASLYDERRQRQRRPTDPMTIGQNVFLKFPNKRLESQYYDTRKLSISLAISDLYSNAGFFCATI